MNIRKIREDFPVLNKVVYLDNAASSQTPLPVLEKMQEYYTEYRANIHRGHYSLSRRASDEYENAHSLTAKYFNADEKGVVFTRNTTESLNLLAYSFLKDSSFKGKIVVSQMEHHANLLPWQMLSNLKKTKLDFIKVNAKGHLIEDDLNEIIDRDTALVSITACSNLTGIKTNYKEILKTAKDNGAIAVLDAAQLAPHEKIDFKKTNADFIAFSSHKMCGPTGLGVLLADPDILENMPVFLLGGDMIREVKLDSFVPNILPWRFEAGTPSIAEAIGFAEALNYLHKIGWENISEYEKRISQKLFSKAEELDIEIIGDFKERGPVLTFKIKGGHPHDVSNLLDSKNIAVRSGMHCAHPLSRILAKGPTTRASFYFYNTFEEVDYLIDALKEAVVFFQDKEEEKNDSCT